MTQNLTSIRILVTNQCNLRCTYCHNEFQPTPSHRENADHQRIDLNAVEQLIRSHLDMSNLNSIKISGGEPTLEPKATCELLEIGRNMKFPKRIVLSNLVSATEEMLLQFIKSGLTHIRVMIPSFDPNIYSQYTSASSVKLSRVLSLCKFAHDAGISVRANMVVTVSSNPNGNPIDLSSISVQQEKYNDSIDEVGLLVDARAIDPESMFKCIHEELVRRGIILSTTFRKVDAIVNQTPIFLRRCEDWEATDISIFRDEIRAVAPGLIPQMFYKGRAYE